MPDCDEWDLPFFEAWRGAGEGEGGQGGVTWPAELRWELGLWREEAAEGVPKARASRFSELRICRQAVAGCSSEGGPKARATRFLELRICRQVVAGCSSEGGPKARATRF